jgi:hypothetical protein
VTLAEPWRLLALLVVPVLWWLSLPSRPQTAVLTPHLQQWQLALAALRRRPPRWSRWRFLLLAMAAAFAALAFAGPLVPGEPGASRLVVVLDASASMAARGPDGRTAWARATDALRTKLPTVPADVEVTLLRAGGPLLRRHGASARALHDLGDPAGELDADLATLAADAGRQPGAAVWTLTDGQGGRPLPTAGARTVLRAAGSNAAVLAVRLVDRWPLPALDLEVDVAAFVDAPAIAALRVSGAIAAPSERTVELAPSTVRTEAFALERLAAGGELAVRIELPGDVLAGDDVWRVELPPLPAPRIAVLADAEAGPFAAVAAEALAAEVGGSVVAAAGDQPVGVVLVEGGAIDLAPGAARAVTFGARMRGAAEATAWPTPVVADWDRHGALTRGLDLSELRLQRAWRGVLPAGEPFLWADDAGVRTPLAVVVAGTGGMASVHFAFRLQDGNLPLLTAFPQLLRRAFVRSYGEGAAPRVRSEQPSAGERDLRVAAVGDDVALPPFATPERDLAPWCVLLALAAVALRAFVR